MELISTIGQKKGGLMRSVARRPRRWKKKVSERRQGVKTMQCIAEVDDLDTKVSLIQMLIPIGLKHVNKLLQDEVRQLAGLKGKHNRLIPTGEGNGAQCIWVARKYLYGYHG